LQRSVKLEIYKNLFSSVCEEMSVVLKKSSFSPNIKERGDFSCAIFTARGELIAHAVNIPVHIGSMPLAVEPFVKKNPLEKGEVGEGKGETLITDRSQRHHSRRSRRQREDQGEGNGGTTRPRKQTEAAYPCLLPEAEVHVSSRQDVDIGSLPSELDVISNLVIIHEQSSGTEIRKANELIQRSLMHSVLLYNVILFSFHFI